MAFDSPTRARLARFVSEARELLASEFAEKFQRLYGISPSGELAPVETLPDLDDTQRATAQSLRERLTHLIAANPSARDAAAAAVARLSREQAFTILNRLAAVRMAEKRGLIVESVGRAYESAGFRVYCQVAGSALGDSYHRYRRYLFCLFDELAVDLGVLFNRRSPFGLLFPRESCLLKLLDLLNAPDLDALWAEDETIGWIYQYYNDEAERKKMRKESAAPRNSRELAVRNQFFTPRYVVEFLTDNTLGRLWYEMTQGNTQLKDQCRYLVRRPTEIFLKPGENPPAADPGSSRGNEAQTSPSPPCPSPAGAGEAARRAGEGHGDEPLPVGAGQGEVGAPSTAPTQEELLKKPVHISHRPLKDPRTILMLDPACGSMHFGLYAFDLFEGIYAEAWDIAKSGAVPPGAHESFTSFVTYVSSFPSRESFLREVPRLIIEHNIHGIDIDPRAVQIAGLSLWLRAQRAWHQAGVKPADRPRITRSNLVCAEPMPGEKHLLKGFVEEEFPAQEHGIFLKFLEAIFDKMQLAGEAGSLLKIEEEIRAAIEEARQAWEKLQNLPAELFSTSELNAVSRQAELDATATLRPLTADFWGAAEPRLLDALRDYAEKTEAAGGLQRRLFADDAAQGFAFIDLCRKRYDVALMNPPFGSPPDSVASMLSTDAASNIYPAFVLRGADLCDGFLGAITDRTFVVQQSFGKFRTRLVSDLGLISLAELGWGVLDGADVQVATYFVRKGYERAHLFVSLSGNGGDPADQLRNIVSESRWTALTKEVILKLPGSAFAHTLPAAYLSHLESQASLRDLAELPRGLGSNDANRTYKAWYEVPIGGVGDGRMYRSLSNGGPCSPFYRDDAGVAEWLRRDGKLLVEEGYSETNRAYDQRDNPLYFTPGLSFPKQASCFNVSALPEDVIPTREGKGIVPNHEADRLPLLAYLNSAYARYFVEATNGLHKQSGPVGMAPVPGFSLAARAALASLAMDGWRRIAESYLFDEASRIFVRPATASDVERLGDCDLSTVFRKIDDVVFDEVGVEAEDRETLSAQARAASAFFKPAESDALHYALGCALGRWDIRYATGELPAPELPDPFAPLPVCPPGMLQGDDGLPMSKAEGSRLKAEGKYPLDVAWDGILVDDPGHPLDIVQRVQPALTTIWGDRAEALEHEACALLGVPTLLEWFRRPAGFFADHLKRYSKSRRQAPIYWPLSTASGSYTLWIYYHRLTDQTLHQVLADFVDPKIKSVKQDIDALRERAGGEGSQVGELQELLDDLTDFRAEIERAVRLPWKPNLNDGVLITACPLWKLFRLPKWRKDLETCWKELERGDYNWAHLAYSIWPQRVKEKCKTDRSLAIAHGLEALCEAPLPTPKARRGRKKHIDLEGLVE